MADKYARLVSLIDRIDKLSATGRMEEMLRRMERATVGLHTKALRDEKLDQAIWDIWSYVRDNAGDNNSSHHCKMIRKLVTDACLRIEADANEAKDELDRTKQQLRETRKLLKQTIDADKVQRENDRETIRELEGELTKLREAVTVT